MSKISELSDGGALQSTDYLIAVRSGGNVKVQPAGMTFSSVTITSSDINGGNIDGTVIGAATPAAGSFTTGQFGTSLNVDGTVTADGLTVDGTTTLTGDFNVQDSANYGVEFRGTSPSVDSIALQARFRDDTDASYWGGANIQFTRDGNWESSITFDTSPDYTNRGGLPRLNIAKNGDISFYEDTGTTPKFFWDASAEALGIGTSSPAAALHIGPASGNAILQLEGALAEYWRIIGATNDKFIISNETDGNVFAIENGNVGIGTTSPAAPFHADVSGTLPSIAASTVGLFSRSATCDVSIIAGSTNLARINFGDNSSETVGQVAYSNNDNSMRFTTNSAEAMRIDSSGNVVIGDPVANSQLTVTDGVAGAIITLKTGGNVVDSVQGFAAYDRQGSAAFPSDPGQLAGYVYVERDGSGGTYDLTFGAADGLSNNAAERMRLTYHGYLRMASGTGGIQFDGATADANTLDDYEEGDYTVTLSPLTSGSITLNGTNDTFSYTKIGRLVHVMGRVTVASVSSPTGAYVSISLPFTAATSGTDQTRMVGTIVIQNAASDMRNYAFSPVEGGNVVLIGRSDQSSFVTNAAPDFNGDELVSINLTYITP